MNVVFEESPPAPMPVEALPEFCKVDDPVFSVEEAFSVIRRGWEPGDQLFTSALGGTYNASLFLRLFEHDLYLNEGLYFEAVVIPLTDDLFKYVVDNIEVDKEHLLGLTQQQLNEPILAVTLNEFPPLYIIDGHHRIIRLYIQGVRELKVIVSNRLISHRVNVIRPIGGSHGADPSQVSD